MIEVSLSLCERDVTKISPKTRLHWDMRRIVIDDAWLFKLYLTVKYQIHGEFYETTLYIVQPISERKSYTEFIKVHD